MDLGLRLFQKDRTSLEAQRLLDAASRHFPKRHDVHLKLLESHLVRQETEAASALLARLQPELDASTRFAFDTTYCLIQFDAFALAQAQWQRANERIQARTQAGATAGAEPVTSPATPQEAAETLFIQGLLATAAGRKDEALALFHRADGQGFPPLTSPQLLMLADSFYWLREYDLATATYDEALQHFPENTQARFRFGLALYWSSQFSKAKRELERVLVESPKQPEANYFLGSTLLELRLSDQAAPYFEKELELDPKCDRCLSALAYLAYIARDDVRARSLLDRAVALKSTLPEIGVVYGMLAIRAEKYDEAIRYLSQVVEKAPKLSQAHFQLAIAYQRVGNAEKAQEHANIFKQLSVAERAPQPPAGQ